MEKNKDSLWNQTTLACSLTTLSLSVVYNFLFCGLYACRLSLSFVKFPIDRSVEFVKFKGNIYSSNMEVAAEKNPEENTECAQAHNSNDVSIGTQLIRLHL